MITPGEPSRLLRHTHPSHPLNTLGAIGINKLNLVPFRVANCTVHVLVHCIYTRAKYDIPAVIFEPLHKLIQRVDFPLQPNRTIGGIGSLNTHGFGFAKSQSNLS